MEKKIVIDKDFVKKIIYHFFFKRKEYIIIG